VHFVDIAGPRRALLTFGTHTVQFVNTIAAGATLSTFRTPETVHFAALVPRGPTRVHFVAHTVHFCTTIAGEPTLAA
jgi:hypothetical protein